jgi:hypothetical protein
VPPMSYGIFAGMKYPAIKRIKFNKHSFLSRNRDFLVYFFGGVRTEPKTYW